MPKHTIRGVSCMSAIKRRRINSPNDRQRKLRQIRQLTPTHILELEIKVNNQQKYRMLKINEHLRLIHNTVLGEVLKNYKQMIRTKEYRKVLKNYRNGTYPKDQARHLFKKLQKDHGVTFTFVRKYGEQLRKEVFKNPDSVTTLSVCEIAWESIEELLYKGAKRVRFYKKGEFINFQGKQSNRSIIFKGDFVSHMRMNFPILIKKDDLFVEETLSLIRKYQNNSKGINNQLIEDYDDGRSLRSTYRIRNNRIVIKEIRGKLRFYLQIALEGLPVPKRNKDGTFRHNFGTGRVGGDIGTQTIAIASRDKVYLKNMAERAEKTKQEERKEVLIQRYLDRSRRATNPSKFDEKGRFIGSKNPWVFSSRYLRAREKLRDLRRKNAINRKLSHNEDVNYIRSLGDEFIIEDMNIKGLQKRAKETTINEKTGRFNRKKRFGKSITNRSPGYLISQAKERFSATGGSVREVNTWSFKASQYCHKREDFIKKKLSERWHKFPDETKVQRDLYSAFLLFCSKDNFETVNQELCKINYRNFKDLHDNFIQKVKDDRRVILNSAI